MEYAATTMGPFPGKSVEIRPTRTVEARTWLTSCFNLIKAQPDVTKQIIEKVTAILLQTIGRAFFKPTIADFSAFMLLSCLPAIQQFYKLTVSFFFFIFIFSFSFSWGLTTL